MKNVTIIAPVSCVASEGDKLRVAAYCRVSTDTEEQLESLDAQIKHYKAYIASNPSWEFAGLFYDEGITGTKKEKRPELLRLISDCENQKVDFIVTKSISRFARNTTDCLELVRMLINLGIFIYFEKENIHTGSMENELMLSILSGLAENESVSISENSKWSVTRRFRNGTYKISYPPYGFDAVNGELIVNEDQAEIVRFVFAGILSGKSTHTIAEALNCRNIQTKKGGRWTATTIRGMIRNEKYIGDAIFQKTYTDTQYNRHQNRGQKDQFLVNDHHESIINREDYVASGHLIDQRAKEKGISKQDEKYNNRYPFSGKIVCGQCGGTFKRRQHASGAKYIAWCCSTHIENIEKCSMKYILDADLEYTFVTMMNKLIFSHQSILKPLLLALRGVNAGDGLISMQDIDMKFEENKEQQNVLVNLMAKGYLDRIVYKKSNNQLLQEADRLQRQKESIVRLLESGNQHLGEVSMLLQYATKAPMLKRFDGDIFNRFVERTAVYSRTEIGFVLKCGLTLKEGLTGKRKSLLLDASKGGEIIEPHTIRVSNRKRKGCYR